MDGPGVELLGGPPERPLEGRIDPLQDALRCGPAQQIDREVEDARQLALGRGARDDGPPELEVPDDHPGERDERLLLDGGELARLAIDDAERSELGTALDDERRSRVEHDVRIARDHRVRGEARVVARVVDDEERFVLAFDDGRAERDVSLASSPTRALNHCRVSPMRLTSATGVPQIAAASATISSSSTSGGVSRIAYSSSLRSRSASLMGPVLN